jgi:photosystem II stability/assembly factor-like uncharacterized protein
VRREDFGPGALARTTDGGRSWRAVRGLGLPYGAPGCPRCIAGVRFGDRRHGYMFGGPFIETADGGRSWSIIPGPAPVIDVETSGREAYALGMIWPSFRTAQLYRLTGIRLVPVGPPLPVTTRWPQLVVHGTGVYLLNPSGVGRPSTLWASHDAGHSWQRLTAPCTWPGADGGALAAWSAAGLALACGSQPAAGNQAKTFYVSTDGGAHWRLTARIGFTSGYVTSLAASLNTWVLAEARGEIAVGSDGGQTWRPAIFLPRAAAVEGWGSVAFTDRSHAVAVPWTMNGDVLAFSSDGGHSWDDVRFGH